MTMFTKFTIFAIAFSFPILQKLKNMNPDNSNNDHVDYWNTWEFLDDLMNDPIEEILVRQMQNSTSSTTRTEFT